MIFDIHIPRQPIKQGDAVVCIHEFSLPEHRTCLMDQQKHQEYSVCTVPVYAYQLV